ncbi:DNA segregation ATPase FtsK/SpoIIIE, S-DNA-T family [Evansella caseinilytica]|uniref:DNA segregation ATPase FtsK/SpoIIIE, S-DNA-T family n=1 Tax=Evansella caseinilytica TaxID=1503961 RepID=A0A1H3TMB7_9BACI|nr:type VII secretion protein EssC [Evansella caseinilytica]SDZ50479.1 DNA segregation ATPase FtsK/SpoIIIE, S-DNA-T family [Evansella caseinilytica]
MAHKTLMISYGNQLHKCHLPAGSVKEVTIGKEWTNTVTFFRLNQPFSVQWNGKTCEIHGKLLNANEQLTIDVEAEPMHFYLVDDAAQFFYDTAGKKTITFGAQEYNDVQIAEIAADFVLVREDKHQAFELAVHQGAVYHNFVRKTGRLALAPGDQLYFDGVTILFSEENMEILSPGKEVVSHLLPLLEGDNHYDEEYPDYHRSPRIIYREPTEKRTIAKPSNKPSKPSEQLLRTILPPLVMIIAFVAVSIFQPRGIYIVVMLSMTVVTVTLSVTYYIKNVKKYKVDMKEREESYREYLLRKTKELYEVSEEQRHALEYHYPDVQQIRELAAKVDARIYEKTMFHHDFLTFRTGLGTVAASFDIDFNEEEFTQEKDELVDAARELLSQNKEIENVPIAASLVKGPVGYIGQRRLVLEQLQLLVMQTALFHSYYDVQFITVFPEEEKADWHWMRWLPHASLRDVNVRGFVYHERSRDQVLHSMYQILKERKLVLDEKSNKNEKMYFFPHYIVLITDEKLILDHTIMELFNEDPSELGVSLVFVQDVMQSLPEHVKTVIDIRDAKTGNIILEEGELVNKHFTPDHFPEGFDKEEVSRMLAPINHLQNLKNSIPESVTFLEMYGVETVEELGIASRWKKNETYKSLAVPLGLRGKDDIVQLNLHEKAHGPHGLVAGTTGSGKSEIIQSYIISLAVNFHPYEVAFLLIDYKGGGMANLFKNMPHLLGTITNLDRSQSKRALASIKAELQRRQRLFGEHGVNHINQYQKLYKQGEVEEAMPHLFLISDEFAELKAEQPDFMKELVSTARIGRSLGIHLILATQKPSGVVDDQIWSNSKFKLALKVQNASDSNEILKTPDAAEITLPGRAYLQVGNNEIYELFQSAWSGADYIQDKDDIDLVDTTIYAINDLGQYDILTEDLSGLGNKSTVEKIPTELDAVIDYLHDYAARQEIKPLPRPWLPPLPERMTPQELHPVTFEEAWREEKKPLRATIGLLDQPELQAQEPLTLDFTKDGHLAVFSSPGYGKSTFLQTVVMDLARQHHPEHLHVYLLDFGTNGLLPLKHLPHVADTILIDEVEKVGKLIRLLTVKMKDRKQKLSKHGVANIAMYEKASGDVVPNLFIVIDNFDSVRESEFAEEFEKLITQVAREGGGVGVHLAISAGRQGAMKIPLLSNMKTQIPLYLIEQTEVRTIIGRTDLEIEEIPGRGLVKLEEPTLFQAMLPAEGAEALEIIDAIQAVAKQMDEHWSGERPPKIPMVPEKLLYEEFIQYPKTKESIEAGGIPYAVDFEYVEPVELNVVKDQNVLVLSDSIDSVEQTFLTFIASISANTHIDVGLIDNTSVRFAMYKENVNIYAYEAAEMEEMTEQLQALYDAREEAFREMQVATSGQATVKDFHQELRPMVILITNVSHILEAISSTAQTTMAKLIENGPRMKIYFLIGAVHTTIERLYDDITQSIKKQKTGVLIGRITDQNILEVVNRPYREQNLLPYEAYFIQNGKSEKIKIVAPF